VGPRHFLVLGAGVVGVTTAYKLAANGHRVTVVDAEDRAAMVTSYANAGLLAPAQGNAWASPSAPGLMLRSLWRGDQAIRVRPRASWRQWRWMLRFLRECTAARHAANSAVTSALCQFSQLHMNRIVRETGVRYDAVQGGLMYIYRSSSGLESADSKAAMLRQRGIRLERMSGRDMLEVDPGLSRIAGDAAGGLYAPGDESGDAHLFTNALVERAEAMGVTFRFSTRVTRLVRRGSTIARVETDKGDMTADDYVLCLGVRSPDLVRHLGIDLPIWPVRGYSITVPVTDREAAPRIGGVDYENLMAYCPMGDRLRITATAEIAGHDRRFTQADFAPLLDKAQAMFGHCADFSNPEYWVGLRPMTPHGAPIVDQSPVGNLWLNVGHGHLGWTMSGGCAAIIADLVDGRVPNYDLEGLRYG
jgi:D-amino-acid dehydrogenase